MNKQLHKYISTAKQVLPPYWFSRYNLFRGKILTSYLDNKMLGLYGKKNISLHSYFK
jgi:hypothetical protein